MPFDRSPVSPPLSAAGDLLSVYRRVRTALLRWRAARSPRRRRGAEACQSFELFALRELLDALGDKYDSGIVDSRFTGAPSTFGLDAPRHRFLVDIDGVENFLRGMPMATITIAVTAPGAKPSLGAIEVSLVGLLDEDRPWFAVRGRGAWQGPRRLRARDVSDGDPIVSLTSSSGGLSQSLRRAATRDFGCTAAPIVMVADGGLDAHIDLSAGSRRETIAAAAHILEEAGGVIRTAAGIPIRDLDRLPARGGLVACSTAALADDLVGQEPGRVTPANGPHDFDPCSAAGWVSMVPIA